MNTGAHASEGQLVERRQIAPGGRRGERATEARHTDAMVGMVGPGETRPALDLLPATRTPRHTNDAHVPNWFYRGSVYLHIHDRRYERERSVAIWIPPGVDHVTARRENTVSLPLGNARTADLTLGEPVQVRFSPGWDD